MSSSTHLVERRAWSSGSSALWFSITTTARVAAAKEVFGVNTSNTNILGSVVMLAITLRNFCCRWSEQTLLSIFIHVWVSWASILNEKTRSIYNDKALGTDTVSALAAHPYNRLLGLLSYRAIIINYPHTAHDAWCMMHMHWHWLGLGVQQSGWQSSSSWADPQLPPVKKNTTTESAIIHHRYNGRQRRKTCHESDAWYVAVGIPVAIPSMPDDRWKWSCQK